MSDAAPSAVGDIVTPLPYDPATGQGHGPLTSGCSRYEDAVVVRLEPFTLVSRGGDMLWSCTVERGDFKVTGCASPGLLKACMVRLS